MSASAIRRIISIKPGQVYRHYKGTQYRVQCVAPHTELETSRNVPMQHVVYNHALNMDDKWIRPLSMFAQTVEYKGKIVPRFALETDYPDYEWGAPAVECEVTHDPTPTEPKV